jgi:hypothetical protein
MLKTPEQRAAFPLIVFFGYLILLAIAISLVGCSTPAARPAQAEKPMPYAVPVATACVATAGRPARPQPLAQRYTPQQWAALATGAKANAVAAQAGARMNYEDEEAAATSACK